MGGEEGKVEERRDGAGGRGGVGLVETGEEDREGWERVKDGMQRR